MRSLSCAVRLAVDLCTPDVVLLLWANIPLDGEISNEINQAPDWVIEILSPQQSPTKVVKDIKHCLKHGAQLGWLIDPAKQTVFVYFPDQRVLVFDIAREQLPVPGVAQNLNVTVEDLFGWLKAIGSPGSSMQRVSRLTGF